MSLRGLTIAITGSRRASELAKIVEILATSHKLLQPLGLKQI